MSDIQRLLQQRYYHLGESKWEHVARRVAAFLCPDKDIVYGMLKQAIVNKELLPSSPTLMNTGTARPMLASCFVLPVEDSIESIMKSLTDTVLIQKYGGGVGLNFSAIRAEGSLIKTTGGKASGPVSFMGFWNEAMNVIRQGGRRQGAMMGVLNVDHPDLEFFLNAKTLEGQLTNFNLSVGLDAEFFLRLNAKKGGYPSLKPYLSGMDAEQILYYIAQHAWENGEPGVLFLDNINKDNPYDIPIEATNPCGEVPLPPYGVCCLGSINLNAVLIEDTRGWVIDWNKLEGLVRLGIQMLDRILTYSWWPIPEVAAFQELNRPLGLGVMGLADILVKLNRPYGSEQGRRFVDYLFECIRDVADDEADIIAKEVRSKVVLSIAPTGSIAMLADASYSIEPYFALNFTKNVEAGSFHTQVSTLVAVLNKQQISFVEKDIEIIERTGSVQETSHLPSSIKSLFRMANELSPKEHLYMQQAVQQHVDSAVSKTINLPTDTTIEDIEGIIILAHDLGLKGLTVYRNRSREVEAITCPLGGTCDD